MTKHGLHTKDVGSISEHLHGERSTQGMDTHSVHNTGCLAQTFDEMQQARAGQWKIAACGGENGIIMFRLLIGRLHVGSRISLISQISLLQILG